MKLSRKQIDAIVAEEVARWREVHAAILEERMRASEDLQNDRSTARELTQGLVASKRVEDKVQLASDEAVAHGLCKLRKSITDDFEALSKQPYFARIVTKEGDKEVEFYLGTSSFTKYRIIDWRKAPISQLYYNYKQGEEFDELIQGRERSGIIKVRRGYKGSKDDLQVIEIPEGIIRKQSGEWIFEEQSEMLSRSAGHDGHLPPILSLITPEQFDLITKSSDKPLIIQGIAGSGKTTVALHRLAWLLHADNSDVIAKRSMVVVFNRALKTYIETTLPELGVDGIAIRTYHQWLGNIAKEFGGGRPYDEFAKRRELEQFKSSSICLKEINEYVRKFPDMAASGFRDDLFKFYDHLAEKQIFWPHWAEISSELKEQSKKGLRDQQDDSVMMNLVFARNGYYPCKSGDLLAACDHIVIDEVQDFGIVEIRALLGALDLNRTVTIVGDIAQKIVMTRQFDSWEELLTEAGFADASPIKLCVPYRSTKQIMQVASHIRSDLNLNELMPAAVRNGHEPTMIRSDSYETQPHIIGKWIEERVKENPNALSAVICRLPKQAESLVGALKKIGYPFVKWGYRDNFDFSPGVVVTNAHQVKGLEFRNVLIVNPTESQYNPMNEEERNLIYVAVTRAQVRLDFVTRDKPTSMLPRFC